jgi:hypothetical protein
VAANPLHIAAWRDQITQIVPNHSTRAQVLWTPGSSGSRVHAIAVANSYNGALTFNLALGKVVTKAATATTGAMATTSGTTITRASGSWVTDFTPPAFGGANPSGVGLVAGEMLTLLDATAATNRGVMARLSSFTATALVFPAATFGTNEAIPDGARIALVGRVYSASLAAQAGYVSISAQNLLYATAINWLADRPDTSIVLDANTVLLGWAGAAVNAANSIDVTVIGGDY